MVTNDFAITGCVLTGGKSSRMGTDKALLEIGNKSLLDIAIEKYSGFPEIIISSARPESYAFTGLTIVTDELSDLGPIGGIISVLKASKYDFVCFRPVDAPLFPAKLHPLIAATCTNKDVAVPMSQNKPEPLFACFSKSALPALEGLVSAQNYKVSRCFELLDTAYIDLDSPDLIHNFGEPKIYLANANDKEAFSKLQSAKL